MGFILLHTPPGLRKSGMPDSVEMPAPVNTTTRAASAIIRARSARLDMRPSLPARARRSRKATGGGEIGPTAVGDARGVGRADLDRSFPTGKSLSRHALNRSAAAGFQRSVKIPGDRLGGFRFSTRASILHPMSRARRRAPPGG